jgi:hypothetical protein
VTLERNFERPKDVAGRNQNFKVYGDFKLLLFFRDFCKVLCYIHNRSYTTLAVLLFLFLCIGRKVTQKIMMISQLKSHNLDSWEIIYLSLATKVHGNWFHLNHLLFPIDVILINYDFLIKGTAP